MQKKNGVSLIVLSITILVMVILAATAVITLENSGIIGRSKNAVSSQQKAEEMTRLIVLKNGVLTDNLGKITVDEYVAELDKKGIIDGTTSIDEYGSTVVKTTSGLTLYIKQNGDSDLRISFEQISMNGTIPNPEPEVKPTPIPDPEPVITLGSLVTAADYGKTINYVSDNGVAEWNIYYHTDDYVYLIATDKLAYNKTPNIPGASIKLETAEREDGTTIEVGHVYWPENTPPDGVTVASDAKTKWMADWADYTSGINAKCVTYFLDETIWKELQNTTKYKDKKGVSYVKGAIGVPTIEMFVASWNAKRLTEKNTKKVELDLVIKEDKGYYVGTEEHNIYVNDTLYGLQYNTTSAIWLASPHGSHKYNLCMVSKGGFGASYKSYYHDTYGLRPVVCLSADTPASIGTEGETDFVI